MAAITFARPKGYSGHTLVERWQNFIGTGISREDMILYLPLVERI